MEKVQYMPENTEWEIIKSSIKYVKGGNRKKHEGKTEHAEIQHSENGDIGICPKNFPVTKAEELIRSAIPEYRATLLDRPKALWNSYQGVVYRAIRSDAHGESWHAFPVKSNIPLAIRRKLLERLETDAERIVLNRWMD